MPKRISLLLLSLMFFSLGYAYDFEHNGIYYDVISSVDNTLAVTFKDSNFQSYSGAIDIPAEINHNNVTYKIVAVGENAFNSCPNLKSAIIPNTVNSIGDKAFYNSGIISLYIGSGVKSIGLSAFDYCPNLVKLILLPSSVPSGLATAFGQSSNQSRMVYVVNDSYNYLSIGTIKYYSYLSSTFVVDGIRYVLTSPSDRFCNVIDFDYESDEPILDVPKSVVYQNIELTVENINNYSFYGAPSIVDVTLNNTGILGYFALSNCPNLTSVEISDNLYNIGNSCFENSQKLETVILPQTITTIPRLAFMGCASLKNIEIPSTLTNIGYQAFAGCKSLNTLDIPASVTTIENNVFQGCSSLSKITFDNDSKDLYIGYNGILYSGNPIEGAFHDCPLNEVYIGRNLLYEKSASSGYSPFYNCSTLRKAIISDVPKSIPDNLFRGCASLSDVSIGYSVSSIGDYAFSGCASLDKFTFGEWINEIGKEAFTNCVSIKTLISEAKRPPLCGTRALDDINKWECKVYTPEKSAQAYKEASQWRDFFFYENLYNAGHILYIQTTNNKFAVNFSGSPKITFPDYKVNLIYNEGSVEWAFEEVRGWCFGNIYSTEPTGINDALSDGAEITFCINGDQVKVMSVNSVDVRIYNTSGHLLVSSKSNVEIDLSALTRGIYIISAGNNAFKFIKK